MAKMFVLIKTRVGGKPFLYWETCHEMSVYKIITHILRGTGKPVNRTLTSG